MIVREYRPGFIDSDEPPRMERVALVFHALDIPWLKEKGELSIDGSHVLANGHVVATIHRDEELGWGPG